MCKAMVGMKNAGTVILRSKLSINAHIDNLGYLQAGYKDVDFGFLWISRLF